MKIPIVQRFRPFSHRPGVMALVPGTDCLVRSFPTLIQFVHKTEEISVRLQLTGPVKDFSLQMDLEKNYLLLFGKAKEGFYRIRISGTPNGVELFGEKIPKIGIVINGKPFCARDHLFFPLNYAFSSPKEWERLSLGIQRAQDWDSVSSRLDMKEIVPFLFTLGQLSPYLKEGPLKGSARLLRKDLLSFYQVAFSHLLVPRIFDDQHQGIVPEEGKGENPFFLLSSAAIWIRSLFFRQKERQLEFLPECPFEEGRMVNIGAIHVGEVDLEWSRSQLRKAVLRCTSSEPFTILLPNKFHSFRIRSRLTERGERKKAGEPLVLQEGKSYLLDRFQKSER